MIEYFIRSESEQCCAILDKSVRLRPDRFYVTSMEFLSLRHRRLSCKTKTPEERSGARSIRPVFYRVSEDFESGI